MQILVKSLGLEKGEGLALGRKREARVILRDLPKSMHKVCVTVGSWIQAVQLPVS